MRHSLLTVRISAREHNETLKTSATHSIKEWTARKESMMKVCSKSPGPTDVWMWSTPNSDE